MGEVSFAIWKREARSLDSADAREAPAGERRDSPGSAARAQRSPAPCRLHDLELEKKRSGPGAHEAARGEAIPLPWADQLI